MSEPRKNPSEDSFRHPDSLRGQAKEVDLDPARETNISEEAVRAQLERLLQSPLLVTSQRLCRFLRFVVGCALDGTADKLKESLIGTEVYDRNSSYDPSQDSIVRTESRRLRNKLKEYYGSEGKDDPVVIYFRLGSYAPLFKAHTAPNSAASVQGRGGPTDAFVEGAGVLLAVLPFVDLSGSTLSSSCARDLTDELIHELTQTPGIRVATASSITSSNAQAELIPELAKKLGVQLIFEGTVKEENGVIRVIARLVNFDGFQVGSQRFVARADSERLFNLTQQLASALVQRVGPEQSVIRRQVATVSDSLLAVFPRLLGAELLLDEGTTTDIQRALLVFSEVSEAFPHFGRSLCGIAQGHCEVALRGAADSGKLLSAARDAATRALVVDSDMISSRVAMAFVQTLQWQWAEAESNFQYALSLGDHALAYRQYGIYLTALGQFDDGFHYLQQANRIDPFSCRQKVAFAKFLFLSSRGSEAAGYFADQLSFGSLPSDALIILAQIEIQNGRPQEAIRLAQENKRNAGAQPGQMAAIAEIMARCGEMDAARRITQQGNLLSGISPVSQFRQALIRLAMKENGSAISHLKTAFKQKEPEMIWLGVDPRFSPLRKMPEFVDMLAKVMARLI